MRSLKNLIVPSVISIIFLFSIGYAMKNTLTNVSEILNFNMPDTTDNPNQQIFLPNDLSSMFNESGYLKSNSISNDGQEIVNDFNGNLMYQIPVSQGKGDGDVYYDVKLTYNGSVNYSVITTDIDETNYLSGQYHKYNFNAPGWILSINGLAVQMLNFESTYFTKPTVGNEARGRDVRLLANGYQITDRPTTPGANDPDKISIMMGDGSVETLENKGGMGSSSYTGWYVSKNRNNYLKAFVYNVTTPPLGEEAGANRLMHLMKGDGLTYIYQEVDVKFLDHEKTTTMPSWFYPQIFLLVSIKDRFGHIYNLNYDINGASSQKMGRPLLTSCPGTTIQYANIWGTYFGMRFATNQGNYMLYTESFGPASEYEHRPQLRKIVNPKGESMQFFYDTYGRVGTDLFYDEGGINDLSIIFGGYNTQSLSRLNKVINFDGGERVYKYYDKEVLTANSLEISYDLVPNHAGAHSPMTYYLGQGRDLFFTNMLGLINIKDGTNEIREEKFYYTYNYTQRSINTESNVWQYPIDENDKYTSRRQIYSLTGSVNNETPDEMNTIREYKNYRSNETHYGIETRDFEGELKLMFEYQYTDDLQAEFRKIEHQYAIGSQNTTTKVWDGTFLESLLKENFGSISRQWSYSYTGGGMDFLSQKVETDPLGLITETNFTHFFNENSPRFFVCKDGTYFPSQSSQALDTVYYYQINLPSEIEIIKGSTSLQKQTNTYYSVTENMATGSTMLGGFGGQLQSSTTHDISNSSNNQTINFVYYNKDTTGTYLYPTGQFRSGYEGNIKSVTDAKGNPVKYYYEIISRKEDVQYNNCDPNDPEIDLNACSPKFTYHKMHDNGTDELVSDPYWKDRRLPSRIDQYADGTRYLSNYQLYNNIGNPIGMVSPNNYYSKAAYDALNRIDMITLPYDFSNGTIDTTVIVNETYTTVEISSKIIEWGGRNELDNVDLGFLGSDTSLLGGVRIEHYYNPSGIGMNPGDIKYNMLMRFDEGKFRNMVSVDSAFLEFSVYYLDAKIGGNSTNDFYLTVTPLDSLKNSGENMIYDEGTGTKNIGNPGYSTSSACTTSVPVMENIYLNNYKRFDITSLFSGGNNIASHGLDVEGIKLSAHYSGNNVSNYFDLKSYLYPCSGYRYSKWVNGFTSPVLRVYGTILTRDTVKKVNYPYGTQIYRYDDNVDTVNILSKIDKPSSNRYKSITHFFDGFGKLYETRLYPGGSSYNSSQVFYNYLDGKGKTVDALSHETKFSYDKYGNLSKTKHPDDSVTLVGNTYQNSLTTNYYTISGGFVNKKTYTDETKRVFVKYFDAAGNLLREEKTVAGNGSGEPQIEDNPFDPDTTYEGQDVPSQSVSLITDYKYDDLYRVIEVKTPNSKVIKYWYDALGRQSQRETPDAGITKYWYDRNNNLTYSQDEVQRDFSPQKYTLRTYDGLNRLLTISEETPNNPEEAEDNPTSGNCFIINCYDSLAYAPVGSIFTNVPSDYYGTAANNTKGSIVATAYKTKLSDSWSFKFYRYDARGRVIKFWNYIAGLGWKTENYYYNSQNQMTRNWYQPNQSDGKVFINTYDDAARLQQVDLYLGSQPGNPEEDDAPSSYYKLTGYTYNANSQIATHKLNLDQYTNTYVYNNRNWIQQINASPYIFRYVLLYNANGNIRFQSLQGDYNNNFSDQDDYYAFYTYDQSNKLTFAEYKNPSPTLEGRVINAYDKDGNLVMMKRKDANDNSIDDFTYSYYNGTNRLKNVTGTATQYNYDDNGNMFEDKLNNNYNCLYDYRNLMTDIKTIRQESSGGPVPQDVTYWTVYKYDEAGNRVRKSIYKYTGSDPDPVYDDNGDNPSWQSVSDEYYVRDVSGKEIAIYLGSSLEQWNIWGLDNVGKINADTTKNYYLKDHLGSTHAVINSTNTVTSAQDYDSWGYLLPNRSYNVNDMKYDYTGKERDNETNYDYFGARYYDSRIGRWVQIEPLLDKYINFTPYCYSLSNPINLFDVDGLGTGDPRDRVLPYGDGGGGEFIIGLTIGLAMGGKKMVEIAPGLLQLIQPITTIDIIVKGYDIIQQTINRTLPHPETAQVGSNTLQSEGDIVKLTDQQVKDYVKEQGYTGDKTVERFKEDVLGQEKISKDKSGSYDIFKDKKTGEHFLKPKKQHEKKLPKIKLD